MEQLFVIALMMVLVFAVSSFFSSQTEQMQSVEGKLIIKSQGLFLRRLFSNRNLCACHLDRTINSESAAVLRVDSTQPRSSDIPLVSLRSSCDFSSTSNTLIRAGQPLHPELPGLAVTSISLEQIVPSGDPDIWSGTIRVKLSNSTGETFRPLEVDTVFQVESGGTATNKRILACPALKPVIGPVSCPAGFMLVGTPGWSGAFCAEINQRPAMRSFSQAQNDCFLQDHPGFNVGQVCSQSRWQAACRLGLFNSTNTPRAEMTSTIRRVLGTTSTMGYIQQALPDCDAFTRPPINTPGYFRCCL